MRFLESRGLDARRIFESVLTLVVMDAVRDADETLRWVRGSDFPFEIGTFDEDADSWGQWWEHVGKEVEHICK